MKPLIRFEMDFQQVDSGFSFQWDPGFQKLDSGFSFQWDPGFQKLDSGFHKQNFPGFRITLHGATFYSKMFLIM